MEKEINLDTVLANLRWVQETLSRIEAANAKDHSLVSRHLADMNGTVVQNSIDIARNMDRVATQWKIGGSILGFIGLLLVGIILRLLFGV